MLIRIVYLLLLVAAFSHSARILAFFPWPIPSHHFIFRPVIEELARRNHSILYVTGYPYSKPPDGIVQMDLSGYNKRYANDISHKAFGQLSILKTIKTLYHFAYASGGVYLGNPKVQELIHSDQRFDAVMFESYFMQEYVSAFIHKFNAIGIEVMTSGDWSWVNELAGLPDNPAYQLDFKTELSHDMNFCERLYSTYVTMMTTWASYYYLHTVMQPVMDRYFNYTGWEGRPSIDVLARNRSLILANSHPSLGHPSPTAPHYRHIGGINIKPNKPLPEDIQRFMDESENGVIYMSFGSNVNLSHSSNVNLFHSFMSAFKDLSQNVLVKYESHFSGLVPPNVKMNQWMPQQDILAHKNVVLFITHGGFLSMSEAVFHGVPLLGVPYYGDQAKNLIFVQTTGFGRMLRHEDITRETVLWNIREITSNSRYKEEAFKRSKLLRDARYTPAEEAVYWIEHSLKYPFALTPKSVSLSAIELHMFDVKLFSISVFIIAMCTIFKIMHTIVKLSLGPKRETKQKKH